MKSEEMAEVRNQVSQVLEKLNDPVHFPCLKHEGEVSYEKANEDSDLLVPKYNSCILKQYANNDKEPTAARTFFPEQMCPTCRLLWYATKTEREMIEIVRVEQLKEAAAEAEKLKRRAEERARG